MKIIEHSKTVFKSMVPTMMIEIELVDQMNSIKIKLKLKLKLNGKVFTVENVCDNGKALAH